MIEKLIIVFTCVLFSVAFAFRNAWQRKEAGTYNPQASKGWHLWEVVIKACFAFAVATLTEGWFHKGFSLLMIASIDFLVFPLVLNKRTGVYWGYLSEHGLDKILRKIPNLLLLFIKFALIIITVTYYITNPYATNH